MKARLHNRIKRLENHLAPPLSPVWHRILLEEGEALNEAIERYVVAGNVVGERDNFILRISHFE